MWKLLLLAGFDYHVTERILKYCPRLFAVLELKNDDEFTQVFRKEMQLSNLQAYILVDMSERLNKAVGKQLFFDGSPHAVPSSYIVSQTSH